MHHTTLQGARTQNEIGDSNVSYLFESGNQYDSRHCDYI